MELEVILGILSALLAGVSAVFAKAWSKIKGKLSKGLTLFIEAVDVANSAKQLSETAVKALEDDKITPEEIADIRAEIDDVKQEIAEVKAAWKDLL